MPRYRALVFAVCLLLELTIRVYCQTPPSLAESSVTSVPPLWGNLHSGAYQVGFRTIFRYDHSRTWTVTRNYDGAFSPDRNGRPVQINLWYPALISQPVERMRFGGYVDQIAPDAFSEFNKVMKQRNREDAAGAVPRPEISALQTTEMKAYRDASPEQGRFPVVLYFGGLNAPINSNLVLAEYLASQGYIVASISLAGPSEEQTFQSRTPEAFESSVRDMEFAWSLLGDEPNVDATKMAVMGHSVGAIDAVILGLRNANVLAVIALDGTYGFQGLAGVLTHSYGYSPEKMRLAFLDLRRAQGAQGNEPLDFGVVESFRHSNRTFITLEKMHHSDFTSFAMVGAQFHAPLPTNYPLNGWNRDTGRSGYEGVCRIVLAFLDTHVRNDSKAANVLQDVVHRMNGAVLRHEDAVPPPPSPLEAAALADKHGIDAVKTIFIASCNEGMIASCVDAESFNTWGYTLLGQHRPKDALAIFQLNAWAHPQSANAQDSLADGFLSVGDRESGLRATQRAIVLAPTDPTLDAAARTSFLSEENAKLQQIK